MSAIYDFLALFCAILLTNPPILLQMARNGGGLLFPSWRRNARSVVVTAGTPTDGVMAVAEGRGLFFVPGNRPFKGRT